MDKKNVSNDVIVVAINIEVHLLTVDFLEWIYEQDTCIDY